ncbi:MAG: hypothetical protein GXY80_13435 [Syntrophorhabdus aromaticivorans]|uniref:Tetratricopeptide repeat protein n=1 Tax=Syntrophorhabdus aromaticivorans TaxID=328301 RepID=A0A971M6L5_9BACT|nr:hypothetical protein [Syntrophorhabdus aromaticivorans]
MRKTVHTRDVKKRWFGLAALLVGLALMCAACSTTYRAYARGMFDGKAALQRGDYDGARRNFEMAHQNEKEPIPLTYLAIVEYRVNNMEKAERLIREAETMEGHGYYYLRALGYKALILLRRDRNEGLEALGGYVTAYGRSDPLMTINDVEAMRRSGEINMERLEKFVEEQVSWYERDVEQYLATGTGYYDGKGFGGPFQFEGGILFR